MAYLQDRCLDRLTSGFASSGTHLLDMVEWMMIAVS
jgi:hypothetical protein